MTENHPAQKCPQKDFPGGPVVGTRCSQGRGLGLIPRICGHVYVCLLWRDVFSRICGHMYVCLLWRDVYLGLLPIFWGGGLFIFWIWSPHELNIFNFLEI